jgi:hypothetical protein
MAGFNKYIYEISRYVCEIKKAKKYIYIYRVIQEESAILWEMIVCDSKQKSSYEHGSDFQRLPRYGKNKIRTILLARTAIT